MSETAWKVAMEAARERCWTIDDCFRSLPMPPAFASAVEAEMGKVVEMLRYIDRDATTLSEAQQVAARLLSRMEGKR